MESCTWVFIRILCMVICKTCCDTRCYIMWIGWLGFITFYLFVVWLSNLFDVCLVLYQPSTMFEAGSFIQSHSIHEAGPVMQSIPCIQRQTSTILTNALWPVIYCLRMHLDISRNHVTGHQWDEFPSLAISTYNQTQSHHRRFH